MAGCAAGAAALAALGWPLPGGSCLEHAGCGHTAWHGREHAAGSPSFGVQASLIGRDAGQLNKHLPVVAVCCCAGPSLLLPGRALRRLGGSEAACCACACVTADSGGPLKLTLRTRRQAHYVHQAWYAARELLGLPADSSAPPPTTSSFLLQAELAAAARWVCGGSCSAGCLRPLAAEFSVHTVGTCHDEHACLARDCAHTLQLRPKRPGACWVWPVLAWHGRVHVAAFG